MPEQHNIEFKQTWHDDFLKGICGFANAQGGTLFVGKDDNGQVHHLADYKTLMDSIPQKVKNQLGILVEVNLCKDASQYYIEIITPPYSVAVSLRGRYYYRSGSTTTELTGHSLTEFLLKKSGKTWDDVTEPSATLADIDPVSVAKFLADAEKAGRMPATSGLTLSQLLEKLRLISNDKLKRAAILLFGSDAGQVFPKYGRKDWTLR